MTRPNPSQRGLLIAGATLLAAPLAPGLARAAGPAIHVVKDPGCGCCTAWIGILQAEGFAVTTEHQDYDTLQRTKRAAGIPDAIASCHTASIEGYVVEGHVPVSDIRRLLAERPQAIGLAVPGMPMGSPGMGPESEREAYAVFLIRKDGPPEVFSRYPAA